MRQIYRLKRHNCNLVTPTVPCNSPLIYTLLVTGDIQTVSWICIHYMPSELVNAQDAPQAWITSYRKLLEAWAMFVDRAAFDNACYSANINKPIMQQVYVSCNYCGKPVSKHTYGMPEGAIPGKNYKIIEYSRLSN